MRRRSSCWRSPPEAQWWRDSSTTVRRTAPPPRATRAPWRSRWRSRCPSGWVCLDRRSSSSASPACSEWARSPSSPGWRSRSGGGARVWECGGCPRTSGGQSGVGGPGRRTLAVLGAIALAGPAWLALYPPVAWDDTIYHLPLARSLVEHGGYLPVENLRGAGLSLVRRDDLRAGGPPGSRLDGARRLARRDPCHGDSPGGLGARPVERSGPLRRSGGLGPSRRLRSGSDSRSSSSTPARPTSSRSSPCSRPRRSSPSTPGDANAGSPGCSRPARSPAGRQRRSTWLSIWSPRSSSRPPARPDAASGSAPSPDSLAPPRSPVRPGTCSSGPHRESSLPFSREPLRWRRLEWSGGGLVQPCRFRGGSSRRRTSFASAGTWWASVRASTCSRRPRRSSSLRFLCCSTSDGAGGGRASGWRSWPGSSSRSSRCRGMRAISCPTRRCFPCCSSWRSAIWRDSRAAVCRVRGPCAASRPAPLSGSDSSPAPPMPSGAPGSRGHRPSRRRRSTPSWCNGCRSIGRFSSGASRGWRGPGLCAPRRAAARLRRRGAPRRLDRPVPLPASFCRCSIAPRRSPQSCASSARGQLLLPLALVAPEVVAGLVASPRFRELYRDGESVLFALD